MTTACRLCPSGIGFSGDTESRGDTMISRQATEVRCLGAGPMDIVAVWMAQPEDLHGQPSSFTCGATTPPVRIVPVVDTRLCARVSGMLGLVLSCVNDFFQAPYWVVRQGC